MTSLSVTPRITPQLQSQKNNSKVSFKGNIALINQNRKILIVPKAEDALFSIEAIGSKTNITVKTAAGEETLEATSGERTIAKSILNAIKMSKERDEGSINISDQDLVVIV